MYCNEVIFGIFYKKIFYNLVCILFWLKYYGLINCFLGILMIVVDWLKFL